MSPYEAFEVAKSRFTQVQSQKTVNSKKPCTIIETNYTIEKFRIFYPISKKIVPDLESG